LTDTFMDWTRRELALEREWELLRNQREFIAALDVACASGQIEGEHWVDEAWSLRRRAAYELWCSCKLIWDLGAKPGMKEVGE
jgi:hypothetical protein